MYLYHGDIMAIGRYNIKEGRENPRKGGRYRLNNNEFEVIQMSNNQAAALVEAIKIIRELASPEQLENALDRIQSVLERSK